MSLTNVQRWYHRVCVARQVLQVEKERRAVIRAPSMHSQLVSFKAYPIVLSPGP